MVDELTLAVVGIDYPNADGSNRRFEVALCVPGEQVDLRPEPKNEHDERAVAVFSARGVQLGYLSAERCGWVGGRMKAGADVAAIFQGLAGSAAYIRARFGGGDPTLPSIATEGRAEPDVQDVAFEADPDGPEWGA